MLGSSSAASRVRRGGTSSKVLEGNMAYSVVGQTSLKIENVFGWPRRESIAPTLQPMPIMCLTA